MGVAVGGVLLQRAPFLSLPRPEEHGISKGISALGGTQDILPCRESDFSLVDPTCPLLPRMCFSLQPPHEPNGSLLFLQAGAGPGGTRRLSNLPGKQRNWSCGCVGMSVSKRQVPAGTACAASLQPHHRLCDEAKRVRESHEGVLWEMITTRRLSAPAPGQLLG